LVVHICIELPRTSLQLHVEAGWADETSRARATGLARKKNVAKMMQKPAELKQIPERGRRINPPARQHAFPQRDRSIILQ
jgi:hypothetical protein